MDDTTEALPIALRAYAASAATLVDMTTPADDDGGPDDDDDHPHTVRVPVNVNMFGKPIAWIDVDPDVAGHWDDRVWRDHV